MRRALIGAIVLAMASVAVAEPVVVEADLGSGVIGVGVERAFGALVSARATVQLERPWYTGIVGGTATDAVGFGVELRPFVFPLRTGPAGFYVSPFARLCAITATDALPMAARGAAWSAGLTAGYGWLVRERRVLVRVGAGVQYWGFALDEGAGIDGLYPDVDIVVGYRF